MIHYLFLLQFGLLPLLAFGDPRIIGTTTTAIIKDEPWFATIRVRSDMKCSGAIISNNYILTAANCVDHNAARRVKVRIGTSSCKSGGSTVNICKIKIHDRFDFLTYDNNLALLKTCEKITATDLIKPIERSDQIPTDNSQANVTGCGYRDPIWPGRFFLPKLPTEAHTGVVQIYNQNQCAADWNIFSRTIWKKKISERSICTKDRRIGANSYDTGAPLVVNNKLVGILSSPGSVRKPDIYSNVIKHSDWIDSNIKE
ncbi:trypsin delta-like [Drosophila ficusphila]|uniref:trypsin delta-like n=1 Tax=Drosophila ficusphila TaxID=30025 RepID=UPI0007E5E9AB|nr:trypsin delta-like [Drosophila ficusphila]